MRLEELDFGKERLPALQLIEIVAVERLFHLEIEIGLGVRLQSRGELLQVRREIACLPEVISDRFHIRRQRRYAAMIVRVNGRLVHTGHQRGAAWGTDRRGGEAVVE